MSVWQYIVKCKLVIIYAHPKANAFDVACVNYERVSLRPLHGCRAWSAEEAETPPLFPPCATGLAELPDRTAWTRPSRSVSVATGQQWAGQGEEGLDHPTHPCA